MKKLDENVTINQVELFEIRHDEDFFTCPESYQVSMTFVGHEYLMTFTVEDLQRAEEWGFQNSGCEGDSVLFYSAESYFENNERVADALMEMMEEEWENNWRKDSPYNYMGMKDDNKYI